MNVVYWCDRCCLNVLIPEDELPIFECALCGASTDHLHEEKRTVTLADLQEELITL